MLLPSLCWQWHVWIMHLGTLFRMPQVLSCRLLRRLPWMFQLFRMTTFHMGVKRVVRLMILG